MIMKKGMTKVTVFYPNTGSEIFDMDYYCNKHVPMVRNLFGDALKNLTIEKGIAGGDPDSPPSFAALGNMYFDSVNDFQNAFAPQCRKNHGRLAKLYESRTRDSD
ncbi:MAG: EthD family reductase [Gracilimonas sp.]